ncbi:MAG TPA: histidine kinase [Mucilaginibacter sp.]|jgi:signal transduction histidine kinase
MDQQNEYIYQLKYLLSILLLLFLSVNISAQTTDAHVYKKCPVTTINYEQGLLNNQTNDVISDPLGFTWVSTSIGLQRYNGYVLENINPIINNDTVKINYPVSLFNLQNGRLWISCKKGILEYCSETDSFKNIIPLNNSSQVFSSIIPIKETSEGIWCFQLNKGLVVYGKDGRLKKVYQPIDIQLINKAFYTDDWLTAGNNDFVFFRYGANKLIEINITKHKFVAVRELNANILAISCSENSVYINTPSGISRFLINGWKNINQYSFKKITGEHVAYGKLFTVSANRLLASANNQLLECDSTLKNCKIYTTANGLPVVTTRNIEKIYFDKFERIWLLTNDDIKRLQDWEIPFDYLKYRAGTKNFVRCLYFDEKKRLLLAGCLNDGLELYDSSANQLWSSSLLTLKVKDVLAIEKLSKDSYLIVTWSEGWFVLDLPSKKLTEFNFPAGNLYKKLLYDNTFTSKTQRINDSTILVASVSNVFKCVFHQNSLKSIKPLLPFFKTPDDRITSFVYTADSAFWVATYKSGVYKTSKNGKLQNFRVPGDFAIRSMAEDADHYVWLGSNSGLYVYNSHAHLINSFSKSSGLLNDCIYGLVSMDKGSGMFASSNMGLSAVSLNGNIKNYTKELGLQENEFNTNAALKTADGKFYFGGINGLTAFYPASLKEFKKKLVLNITRLVVNDSSYNSSAGIWKGDTLVLKYNQNHLLVDFAAMGLFNTDKYLYKYRLWGFEKTWQSTQQPTGIRYILGTGNYILQASCSNALSGQSFTKNITIIVNPPWWLTWWFLLIIAILAVGIVIAVVTFYNKRKYQKKLQSVMIKQSLQNQRDLISRDLHDNLGAQANAIFYGTELLKQKNDNDDKLVEDLHDTAGDMLTVLRETLWALKADEVSAADIWLRVLNFTRKIGTYYREIKIIINGEPPVECTINASMALNIILIVQEAINNAVRHSDASTIQVNSYSNYYLWGIEITDNGKGFEVLAVPKNTESYGLDNMAERANESNIAFAINSVPLHGTKVSLEVSLQQVQSKLMG